MAFEIVEKACIVCGMKSYRPDWREAQYPACEAHSVDEVKRAIAKAAAGSATTTQPMA